MSKSIVFVGLRPSFSFGGVVRGKDVRYFATKEEVKPPFVLSQSGPEKDIADLMKHYGWKTVEEALRTMNR